MEEQNHTSNSSYKNKIWHLIFFLNSPVSTEHEIKEQKNKSNCELNIVIFRLVF